MSWQGRGMAAFVALATLLRRVFAEKKHAMPAAARMPEGERAAPGPEQSELAARLAKYDPKVGEAYLGALHALRQGGYPDQLVHTAHSLRAVIDLLARRRQDEGGRKNPMNKKQRKAALQATFDPLDPQASSAGDMCNSLATMYGELSGIAHHGQATTEGDIAKVLSEIESILGVLTTPQLAVNEEVDDLLSRPPSAALARRLIKMPFRWAAQRRLAEALPDHWLPYMREAGYFSNPLPATGSSYTVWPPALYLKKCAKKRGSEVAEIILDSKFEKISDRNPAVYIDFLECALALSLPDAEKIARKALQEKWSDFVDIYILCDRYFELTTRLYNSKMYCVATEMAYSSLASQLQGDGASSKSGVASRKYAMQLDPRLFEYNLSEKALPLAQKNPWPVIELLGRLLAESIELESQKKTKGDKDGRGVEKDGAPAPLDCGLDDGSFALPLARKSIVDCIRRCICDHIPRTPDGMVELRRIMGLFYKNVHCEFRRLEMSTYAEFPHEFRKEIETSLLHCYGQLCTHDEYHRLLRVSFGGLPLKARGEVLKLIESGFSPEKLRLLAKENGWKAAKAIENRRKLRQLDSIKDHLQGEHRKAYSLLLAEFGKPDHSSRTLPDITFQDMSAAGDRLAGKDAGQVFEYMKDYQAVANELLPDSTVGIEFVEYVRKNPAECSRRAAKLKSYGAPMQYCLLAGLDGALQGGSDISWDDTLHLIEHILKQPQTGRRGTIPLINAACSLIESGLKKDLIGIGMRSRVWKALESLVEAGTRNGEKEVHFGGENSLDISRNSIGGMSFHAVYRYAVWCARNGVEERALAPEAKRVFDSYLNRELGAHTAARHAVLGFFLPDFYRLDRKWATALLSRAWSGKEEKIAFWDGYVSWNSVHPRVFKDHLSQYSEFLRTKLIRNMPNKYPYESTVAHAMLAYFYGLEGADDLVELLLARNDDKAADCARQTGIIIKGKEDDDDFDKEKLACLWGHPSLGQCDLTIWFVVSPLDKRRSISLYRNYIAGYASAVDPLRIPVSTLCKYARDFPVEVAECLDMLLDKSDRRAPNKSGSYAPDSLRDTLKQAIDTKNGQAVKKCRAVIEKIAQRGPDWRDLLEERGNDDPGLA